MCVRGVYVNIGQRLDGESHDIIKCKARGLQLKTALIGFVLCVILTYPVRAAACSLAGCAGNGVCGLSTRTGESPIMNLVHRIDVPINGARIKLQDPLTGNVYNSVSDDNGDFAFDSAPKG